MARPKKRDTPAETIKSNSFIDALRFVGSILKEQGAPFETHVFLNQGTATAFNGVLASGIKITEDIYALPHNKLLIEALSKCGENLSITQLDNNRLSIKSDKFKAVVPCLDPATFGQATPDTPCNALDDRFKTGLEAVGVLASETAQSVVAASILMQGNSLIATNRIMIFEYWHGLTVPSGLALPKAVVQPLLKNQKKLISFGNSNASATFYYEDESWIRTQFYAEPWPNIDAILEGACNPFPLPSDFWKAVEAVTPFSENGLIYFDNNMVRSHSTEGFGASHEVSGLPKGPIFNAKQLQLIKPHAQTVDFFASGPHNTTMLKFFGQNIRGAIAGRVQ